MSPTTAERVIARVGLAGIRRLSAADLETSCSISKIAARRIVVSRDLAELFMRRATTLSSAAAVMAYLPPGLASLESEVILGFALNAAMAVIGGYLLAKGGGSLVSLTARDVFVPLLRASASAFVLVHNHPSGDPMPSPEDVRFTESIADAAHVLDIAFTDHLIVAQSGITSMLELGLIPTQEHSTTSTVRS